MTTPIIFIPFPGLYQIHVHRRARAVARSPRPWTLARVWKTWTPPLMSACPALHEGARRQSGVLGLDLGADDWSSTLGTVGGRR
jgi:hypothetical protein